jgi:hypothetical protein
MLSFTILPVFNLLPLLALAIPLEPIIPIPPCDARIGVPGGAYICPLANFTPSATQPCKWLPPAELCYTFGADASSKPHSVGPDAGGYCEFFRGTDCTGVAEMNGAVLG